MVIDLDRQSRDYMNDSQSLIVATPHESDPPKPVTDNASFIADASASLNSQMGKFTSVSSPDGYTEEAESAEVTSSDATWLSSFDAEVGPVSVLTRSCELLEVSVL